MILFEFAYIVSNLGMKVAIGSGSKWEDIVGYSRAVRVWDVIEVAGTTAVDGDTIVGHGDVYAQANFIFKKIQTALQQVGAGMQDVVRTRMYITDITLWEQAGKAHGEWFKNIKPAATMVEVAKLIDPDLLIEIEVTAVVQNDNNQSGKT
jgi:enamine deaminase RidA (YjgF/YER057c/UK114 family)